MGAGAPPQKVFGENMIFSNKEQTNITAAYTHRHRWADRCYPLRMHPKVRSHKHRVDGRNGYSPSIRWSTMMPQTAFGHTAQIQRDSKVANHWGSSVSENRLLSIRIWRGKRGREYRISARRDGILRQSMDYRNGCTVMHRIAHLSLDRELGSKVLQELLKLDSA